MTSLLGERCELKAWFCMWRGKNCLVTMAKKKRCMTILSNIKSLGPRMVLAVIKKTKYTLNSELRMLSFTQSLVRMLPKCHPIIICNVKKIKIYVFFLSICCFLFTLRQASKWLSTKMISCAYVGLKRTKRNVLI